MFGGRSTNIQTDGLGRTTGTGKNNVAMAAQAMALSGDTLPQVTPGGSIKGTFHVVTTDGAGPIQAVLDPTATGKFSTGMMLTAAQQIPGNNGNIAATRTKGKAAKGARDLLERALRSVGLVKRAANVNRSFPFEFTLPAGATCNGQVAGQQNVCLVKIANSNRAGPFGGVVAVQMAAGGAAAGNNTPAGGAGAAAGGQKAQGAQQAKAAGNGKTAREFTA